MLNFRGLGSQVADSTGCGVVGLPVHAPLGSDRDGGGGDCEEFCTQMPPWEAS